jgi:hypothetical protein
MCTSQDNGDDDCDNGLAPEVTTVISSKAPPAATTSRVLVKDQVLLCRVTKVVLQEVLAVEIITTAANCELLHTSVNTMINKPTQRLDVKV